nr:hypothetical protein [Nocardia miyunensis]
MRADFQDELRAEANSGVVGFDRVFDERDVDVRCVAGAVLSVAAEEVGVFGAPGLDDVLDDHALSDADSFTALAEQRPLQVVVMHPPTLAGCGARVDDVLNPFEQVFVDQGLVAAPDFLVVVVHVTEVVAVPQHLGQLVDRYLFGGMFQGGPGPKATVVEFFGQLVEGVGVGGVQLEGELHQRRAFRVDGDGADLAAVESVDHVQVAQAGAADGASVADLLPHLVGDVGSGFARLVFVEGGQDAVHELTNG